MKPSNITRVISLLINELHIPVTRQSIEEENKEIPMLSTNGRKLPKPYQTEDIKYFI